MRKFDRKPGETHIFASFSGAIGRFLNWRQVNWHLEHTILRLLWKCLLKKFHGYVVNRYAAACLFFRAAVMGVAVKNCINCIAV
jgi:hypothetical protein